VTLRIDWHLYREVNAPSGERRPIRLRAELLHGWVGPCRVRPEDAEAAAQYLLEESMKDLADEYRKQNGLADAASAQK